MRPIDRRAFLGWSLGVAGGLGVSSVLPSCQSPGERRAAKTAERVKSGGPLRIGVIGVNGQGGANLGAISADPGTRIEALCDVDLLSLDAAAAAFPNAKRYRDFRALLAEDSLELDGVVISTPDHTHAPAAAQALRRGLGVYLEKPLTHTVDECRQLLALARENRCVTQMGTLIHAGNNYRRVVEAIRAGVIGQVTQVDCWCPKSWCCGELTPGKLPPPQLDWTLWQGPIAEAAYIDGIHPANWRRFWRYGTGTLGDMGCHILDLPMWALGLDQPQWNRFTVTAEGPPLDPIGCPAWQETTWAFPRPEGDPLVLRWFDGGRIPPTVREIGAKSRQDYFGRYMVCFQGSRGFLMANYDEMEVLMVPDAKLPAPTIAASKGHHREWLDALREGRPTGDGSPLCRFEYAAPLTELVLLGTVAYRAGGAVEWDRARGLVTGPKGTKELLSEQYRDGWSL